LRNKWCARYTRGLAGPTLRWLNIGQEKEERRDRRKKKKGDGRREGKEEEKRLRKKKSGRREGGERRERRLEREDARRKSKERNDPGGEKRTKKAALFVLLGCCRYDCLTACRCSKPKLMAGRQTAACRSTFQTVMFNYLYALRDEFLYVVWSFFNSMLSPGWLRWHGGNIDTHADLSPARYIQLFQSLTPATRHSYLVHGAHSSSRPVIWWFFGWLLRLC